MPTVLEATAPTTLSAANLKPRGHVHPSPVDWRDQTFYFLLPEPRASTPLLSSSTTAISTHTPLIVY